MAIYVFAVWIRKNSEMRAHINNPTNAIRFRCVCVCAAFRSVVLSTFSTNGFGSTKACHMKIESLPPIYLSLSLALFACDVYALNSRSFLRIQYVFFRFLLPVPLAFSADTELCSLHIIRSSYFAAVNKIYYGFWSCVCYLPIHTYTYTSTHLYMMRDYLSTTLSIMNVFCAFFFVACAPTN